MQLAHITTRPPHLVQALEALAQRADHQEAAQALIHELSGITVLVAKKFTNDRMADGLLEAFYLTVGCISLGISQANIPEESESKLSFLLHHGAEYVFQMGFRHIKELSGLPYHAFVSDFDSDPFVQQLNVKALFSEICRADPNSVWTGDDVYKKELLDRKSNQRIVECAKWLRKKHFAGPVKNTDLDANAVIAIAVIFAILGDGRIVARTGQKEIESLIRRARETRPDIEAGWNEWLKNIPHEYQPILRERMDEYRNTIVKKILSKTRAKTVITEIQNYYAGDEMDVDYP
ncbi:MAG: hypothetical protein PHG89_02425 [Gallionella sp.]|nr:hypothetical protein [Gallionella sp.]